MSLSYVLVASLALVATVNGEECKCPINIQNYYKELNCNPVNESGSCCPTKFDCDKSLINRSPEKCHFRGSVFEPKAILTEEEIGDPCVPECRCIMSDNQATFECVDTDCPEFSDTLEKNCVRLYELDQCCSTGIYCSESVGAKTKATDVFTCDYSGKTYFAGQQFYPDEVPCKRCVCQQGYDGTLNGPWCADVSCGVELHNGDKILDGCAPIFFGEKGCCPIKWRCPESGDSVVPAPATEATAASTTTAQCTFGSLKLNVLDMLNKSKPCVTCTCSVPPHVSCIQKGYC